MKWLMRKMSGGPKAPVIHIHEDYWMMRSLQPKAAWEHVADDIDEALEHAQKNADPVTGYPNAIRAIEPPSIDYRSTGLKVSVLKEALAPHMPFVSRFYATVGIVMETGKKDPYGSYEEDAVCFGFDQHCYVKVEVDGDAVTHIWFEADTPDQERLAALRQCFNEIDALAPSVIADYWHHTYGPLAAADFLDEYFAGLADHD